MNIALLDVLTNTELRDTTSLQAAAIEQVSAGIPWLTGEGS